MYILINIAGFLLLHVLETKILGFVKNVFNKQFKKNGKWEQWIYQKN